MFYPNYTICYDDRIYNFYDLKITPNGELDDEGYLTIFEVNFVFGDCQIIYNGDLVDRENSEIFNNVLMEIKYREMETMELELYQILRMKNGLYSKYKN